MVTGPVRYGRKAVMYSMACSPRSVKDVVTGGMGLLSSGSWTQVVKASTGLDSMTCTKSELVASTLKE